MNASNASYACACRCWADAQWHRSSSSRGARRAIGTGAYVRTKVVTLAPRFVVVNSTPWPLEIGQCDARGTPRSVCAQVRTKLTLSSALQATHWARHTRPHPRADWESAPLWPRACKVPTRPARCASLPSTATIAYAACMSKPPDSHADPPSPSSVLLGLPCADGPGRSTVGALCVPTDGVPL
jgi:hypothetical protein